MMKKRLRIILLVAAVTLALGFAAVHAQSTGTATGYHLGWWSVDSGGGQLSAGGYVLNGTVGQPDAGVPLTAGGYTLTGGFWSGPTVLHHSLYLPVVTKSK